MGPDYMKISILGTEYAIEVRKYGEDASFDALRISGYCDDCTKQLVICDMSTHPEYEHENPAVTACVQKETVRHEIIHAFFSESGLTDSSNPTLGAWAKNEEMVDWFALQGPKIYKAWQEAEAL